MNYAKSVKVNPHSIHSIEEYLQESLRKAEETYRNYSNPDFSKESHIIDSVIESLFTGTSDTLSDLIDVKGKELIPWLQTGKIYDFSDHHLRTLGEIITQTRIIEELHSLKIEDYLFGEEALDHFITLLTSDDSSNFDLRNYPILNTHLPLPKSFRILRNLLTVLKRFKETRKAFLETEKP